MQSRMIRDCRFDVLKAIAIAFVVFGHVSSTIEISVANSWVGAFIVGMNMPLFFVLSGYFADSAVQDGARVLCRCGRYLKAMIAYAVLLAAVFYGLGIWGFGLAVKRCFTIPFYGWWYMWVLMLCLLTCFALRRFQGLFVRSKRTFALLSIGLFIVLLMVPDAWWQMKYFKFNLPFFVLGCAIKRYDAMRWLQHSRIPLIWILSFVSYMVYVMYHTEFPTAFYWANLNLVHIVGSGSALGSYVVRYFVAVAGILTLAFPVLKMRESWWGRSIAELGTTTMGVYFLHQPIIRQIIVPFYRDQGALPFGRILVIAIVLWLGCHLIASVLASHALTRKLFN